MRTPKSEIDKRYEEKHKAERKAAHATFGTSIPRKDFDEINTFLKSEQLWKDRPNLRRLESVERTTEYQTQLNIF